MAYTIPKNVWSHLHSAQSLLDDAAALPPAFKHNATRYFLCIKGWELYRIANEKFSAWALRTTADPKLLRDHGYKLDGSPRVLNIVITDGKPVETSHETGEQKKELLQTLIYGSDDKSRQEIFMRGWHFDTFVRRLHGKIELLRITLRALEEIE
jgi:hypothetical protein